MQQIQYFNSAWGDIKNSPGWFGKLCLLALVNLIPVFGSIVSYGYLYGWAREIAWGTHEPMPARIFGNEDGKLYRRGWFIFVLVLVASLVPYFVMQVGSGMQGVGFVSFAANSRSAAGSIASVAGLLVYLVGFVGLLLCTVLAWIGSMRISIYDRLSAGFQVGKLWKMLRHDTNGALRIFGMYLLVSLILGIILSVVLFILIFFVTFAGVASLAASGYDLSALQNMSDAQAATLGLRIIAGAGIAGFFGIVVVVYLATLASMFAAALVARAMGYWTMQFDVPRWRGQDDPMPFETGPAVMNAVPATPVQPSTQAPYAPYGQQATPSAQPEQTGQFAQPDQSTQAAQAQQPVQPAGQAAPEASYEAVDIPGAAPKDSPDGQGSTPE